MPDIAVSSEASKLAGEYNAILKQYKINKILIEFCQPIIANLTGVQQPSPV